MRSSPAPNNTISVLNTSVACLESQTPSTPTPRLGDELGYKPGGKLKYMALGQGMGPKAVELIETGAQRGLWVMLQVRGRGAGAAS